MYGVAENINELGGSTEVSTLTVLKAFTKLGHRYHTLLFYLHNTGAVDCTLIIETSEDGTRADANQTWSISVQASKQGSLEVGPGIVRRYWRISAQTAGAATTATWGCRGVERRGFIPT